MSAITLKITSKLPKEYKEQYSGGCLTETGTLYFGWRGKPTDNMCFAVGQAIQKALLLFTTGYDEVILQIDADYTETRKPEKLSFKKSNKIFY